MAAATAEDQRRLLPLHGDHQRRDYHSIPIRPSGNSADESFSNASSFSTSSSSSSTSSTAYPSYSYLILSHALGLIPSLLFLALFAGFALRIPCRLPLPSASCRLPSTDDQDENVAASEQRCAALLGPGSMISWSLFLLSVAAFTAAHKVRNLISRLCTLAIRLARACSTSAAARGGAGSGPPDEASRYDVLAKDEEDTAATIFSFVSRAFFTEGFKILLVVVASAVVLAKTFVDGSRVDSSTTSQLSSSLDAAPLRHHSSRHDAIPRLTKLDGHDGRFRIAVWLALGWATAELLSGTVQLFRQLSMYSPTLMDEAGGAFLLGGGEGKDADEVEEREGLMIEEEVGGEGTGESQQHAAVVDPPDSPSSIYRGHTGVQANGGDTNSTPHATTLSSARQQLQHRQRRPSSAAPPAPPPLDPTAIQRLESQIDRLIAARTRVKLERTLGASLMELPVAISAVWRLDSALWSTGSVLLLSAAVALGQGMGMFDVDGTRRAVDEEGVRLFPRLGSLYVTFTILAALYAVFHSVWRLALASWGVTYPSLLVGLGMVVSGLARWGLVV